MNFYEKDNLKKILLATRFLTAYIPEQVEQQLFNEIMKKATPNTDLTANLVRLAFSRCNS